jgi:hypothetical protein
MQLPPPSAHYSKRVDYGRYVTRRLRRAKRTTLAVDVEAATQQVLARGRELEDADGPVQDGLADRDAADDELDDVAQQARHALAGRSLEAARSKPYTLIFPDGITYYTAAPLEEEVRRYGELKSRLVEHLVADDSVRIEAAPTIEAGLTAFTTATTSLEAARTAKALASTRLEAAEESWGRLLEKVYGALVQDVGRAMADRFFPKVRVRKAQGERKSG